MKILSLFDYSGEAVKPYAENGHKVFTLDIKVPQILHPNRTHIVENILDFGPDKRYIRDGLWSNHLPETFDTIFAFVPCTDFALCGAKHFAAKDADGRTTQSIALVKKTLEIIQYYKPRVWVIENPMSRIHKLVPELGSPRFKFHPYEFGGWVENGENRRKQTWLWGQFNIPEKRPIEPEPKNKHGSGDWINKVGGKTEKTKEYRSMTPRGFAKAFYEANK